jgi:hypothetical protein
MQKRALIATLLLGLGSAEAAHAEQLFAQSNLLIQKGKLTSINYRSGQMIPVGTTIKVLEKSGRAYKCISGDGVEFTFVPTKHVRLPIEKAFALFVSKEDPAPRLAKLSESDRALVKQATVTKGMSKEAVKLSIGVPPSHKTPSLDSATWLYWKTKFDTFKVIFDGGVVLAAPGWEVLVEAPPPPPAKDIRYAAVNVHTLEGKVSWVNYLKGPLIPIGTKIEVTDVDGDEIEFKIAETGAEYTFENDKDESGMATEKLFERFFSKAPEAKLAGLDPAEQRKVKGAEIGTGMTRDAVLMALGPPPPHQTPTLDSSTWTYWKSRMSKMKVTFGDDDKVKAVE